MKYKVYVIIGITTILLCLKAKAQEFNDLFFDQTIRMNYIIAGNNSKAEIFLSQYISEGIWAGKRTSMEECIESGSFKMELKDSLSGKTIYAYSFGSLFDEWQLTLEAKQYKKAFREAVRFPCPKKSAIIEIYQKDTLEKYHKLCSINFSKDLPIKKSTIFDSEDIMINGSVDKKIDIVLLAENYKSNEINKFSEDAKRFTNHLFEYEPYKSNKDKFNVRIVKNFSKLDFSYNTFSIDRYLTSENYWAICDKAASVPWDIVVVIINHKKYGGSGIFNFYCSFISQNTDSEEMFVHEFGHLFAGLEDEYTLDYPSKNQKQKMQQNCIMRSLDTKVFCPQCKNTIKKFIKYYTE